MALLLPAVVLPLACSAGDERVTTTADMVAVSRLMVTFDRLSAAGDVDGVTRLFTDDAVLMPPNEPAVVGRRLLRKWFQERFDRVSLTVDHEPLEVDASGRFIVHRGRAAGTARRGTGEPVRRIDDKYLFVLKAEPNGSLKIWRAMYNSNFSTVQTSASE